MQKMGGANFSLVDAKSISIFYSEDPLTQRKEWICAWFLYPFARLWDNPEKLRIYQSYSKGLRWLVRWIYEKCWAGSTPLIPEHPWIDKSKVTQRKDSYFGTAPQHELLDSTLAFCKYQFTQRMNIWAGSEPLDYTERRLQYHELALAVDQCFKTYVKYDEYVKFQGKFDENNWSTKEKPIIKALKLAQTNLHKKIKKLYPDITGEQLKDLESALWQNVQRAFY